MEVWRRWRDASCSNAARFGRTALAMEFVRMEQCRGELGHSKAAWTLRRVRVIVLFQGEIRQDLAAWADTRVF